MEEVSVRELEMRHWADTVETVLSNLALSKAPPADIALLRQAVLDAADKAVARRRAKRAKAAKEKEAAPTPPKEPTEG